MLAASLPTRKSAAAPAMLASPAVAPRLRAHASLQSLLADPGLAPRSLQAGALLGDYYFDTARFGLAPLFAGVRATGGLVFGGVAWRDGRNAGFLTWLDERGLTKWSRLLGRDFENGITRNQRSRVTVRAKAEAAAEERILDGLVGPGAQPATRDSFRKKLRAGEITPSLLLTTARSSQSTKPTMERKTSQSQIGWLANSANMSNVIQTPWRAPRWALPTLLLWAGADHLDVCGPPGSPPLRLTLGSILARARQG